MTTGVLVRLVMITTDRREVPLAGGSIAGAAILAVTRIREERLVVLARLVVNVAAINEVIVCQQPQHPCDSLRAVVGAVGVKDDVVEVPVIFDDRVLFDLSQDLGCDRVGHVALLLLVPGDRSPGVGWLLTAGDAVDPLLDNQRQAHDIRN